MDTPQYWLDKIAEYSREFQPWESRSRKILQRYRDEQRKSTADSRSRFAILWSNVQTLSAALFARLPQPEVMRRHGDRDAVGRVASQILERALAYELQHYNDYSSTLRAVIHDRLLGGRGVAWARYEPRFRAMEAGIAPDGELASEDVSEPVEQLDYECAPVDYVHWQDFGHSVARSWEEVTAVWRRVYMTREQLEERFGEVAAQVPLDAKPKDDEAYRPEDKRLDDMGAVYEVWHKPSKTVYWLAKGVPEFLDVKPDPLGLDGFWPCPKPLYATITNDCMVPVPDFTLYQDQAHALDVLSDRIDGLINALRVRGVYDASESALARLFTEGENNSLLPIKNWLAFAEKGGMNGAIALVDIKPIAEALQYAYAAAENIKGQIYEITGISDIIRGSTDSGETATAQQIKSQYASLRLRAMQDDVTRFATDLLMLKAQIICQKFDPQTIASMAAVDQMPQADQQFLMPAMQLLVGERMMMPEAETPNVLRTFRIRVASDSLVYMDEQAEKEQRMEFLSAAGAYIKQAMEASMAAPQIAPLLMEMFRFGVGAFKAAEPLEGFIDQLLENPQPQVPPEELQRIQQEAMAQAQQEVEGERQKVLGEKQQVEAAKMQLEMGKQALTLEQQKIAAQQQISQLTMERDYLKTKERMNTEAFKVREDSLGLREQQTSMAQKLLGEREAATGEVAQMMQAMGQEFLRFAQAMQQESAGRNQRGAQILDYLAKNGSPQVRDLVSRLQ